MADAQINRATAYTRRQYAYQGSMKIEARYSEEDPVISRVKGSFPVVQPFIL